MNITSGQNGREPASLGTYVDQLIARWTALEPGRKLLVVLSLVAVIVCTGWIVRLALAPSMSLLYAGLEGGAASEVINALEAQGTPYEVRGTSIYVPRAARDQARLALAAEGLPSGGAAGYELLDSLSGFGTTSQMFDAAYWRAKEGELARTIAASPNVRSARVHIARGNSGPFERDRGTTASVTVSMGTGTLSRKRAEAIRFLVASAVIGLSAEDVSVLDDAAGVVLAPGASEGADASQQSDREARLRASIERLLAARVGPGRALVEVMIDADPNSETVTERVLDPESRVAIHSDIEESSETESGTGPGNVTVASNLPDGDAAAAGSESNRQNAVTRERINYEVSEIMRESVRHAGEIRRITVAVLVDGITSVAADGTSSWQPRPDAELTAMRNLVESAIGFDAARGDLVTIESLEFTASPDAGTAAASPGFLDTLDVGTIIQIALLGLVTLALGMFVIKPILTPRMEEVEDAAEGEILEATEQIAAAIENNPEARAIQYDRNDTVVHLRDTVRTQETESAAILRSWIDTPEPEEAVT
ncbi:MAG: flagellar basal-body MS-ring/collar protein FliF [Pseudomonadota bacterium]